MRPDFYYCNEEGSFADLTYRVRLPSILERVFSDWKDELGDKERSSLLQLKVRPSAFWLACSRMIWRKTCKVRRWESLRWTQSLTSGAREPGTHCPFCTQRCTSTTPFSSPLVTSMTAAKITKWTFSWNRSSRPLTHVMTWWSKLGSSLLSSSFCIILFRLGMITASMICSKWSTFPSLETRQTCLFIQFQRQRLRGFGFLVVLLLLVISVIKDGELDLILANDTRKLCEYIEKGSLQQIDFVVDNYCFEIFNDLRFVRFLFFLFWTLFVSKDWQSIWSIRICANLLRYWNLNV